MAKNITRKQLTTPTTAKRLKRGAHWAYADSYGDPLIEVTVVKVDADPVLNGVLVTVTGSTVARWVPVPHLRVLWSNVSEYRAAVSRWTRISELSLSPEDAAAIRSVYGALPDLTCAGIDPEYGPNVTEIRDVEAVAALTGIAPRTLLRSPGAFEEGRTLYVFGTTSRRLAMEIAAARRTDVIGWILNSSEAEVRADQTVLGWIGGPQLTEAEQQKVMAELDAARRKLNLIRIAVAALRAKTRRPMKKRVRKALVKIIDSVLRE